MLTDKERVLRIAIDSAVQDAHEERDERLAKWTIVLVIGLYTVGVPGFLGALRFGVTWAAYLYVMIFIVAGALFLGSRVALRTMRARRADRHDLLAKLYQL